MKVFPVMIALLIGTSAFAMEIPTTPAQGRIVESAQSGKLASETTDFIQRTDGTFVIHVYAEFHEPHYPNEFVDAGTFTPTEGVIVRNGNTLDWEVNGKSIEIARTFWLSTFPKWSLENNVVRTRLTHVDGPYSGKYTASVELSAF